MGCDMFRTEEEGDCSDNESLGVSWEAVHYFEGARCLWVPYRGHEGETRRRAEGTVMMCAGSTQMSG